MGIIHLLLWLANRGVMPRHPAFCGTNVQNPRANNIPGSKDIRVLRLHRRIDRQEAILQYQAKVLKT